MPNTLSGLLASGIKGIMARMPAHVTALLTLSDWYYTTDAVGAELRKRAAQQGMLTLNAQ